jgi:DNA-binding protein YbaB
MDEPALAAAEDRVNGWLGGFERRAARARDLSTELSGLTVTATSENRLVSVTVDSSGMLAGLRLDEGVRKHSGRWIADQIMLTTQSALRILADRVGDAVGNTIGSDSSEGRAIVALWANRLTPVPEADIG